MFVLLLQLSMSLLSAKCMSFWNTVDKMNHQIILELNYNICSIICKYTWIRLPIMPSITSKYLLSNKHWYWHSHSQTAIYTICIINSFVAIINAVLQLTYLDSYQCQLICNSSVHSTISAEFSLQISPLYLVISCCLETRVNLLHLFILTSYDLISCIGSNSSHKDVRCVLSLKLCYII